MNREQLIPQYAQEYFAGGRKHYAFLSTELIRGLPVEEAFLVLEKFQIEIRRVEREHRESTVSDLPQKRNR